MPTTVYFATNRVVTGPPDDWQSYGTGIVAPSDASRITYAEAFVDGINLAVEGSGTITTIAKDQQGDFGADTKADILGSGRDILVFIHGFANSFKDAITRAAYNREWFAAGGSQTTMITFTWPSLGQLVATPPQMLQSDYQRDQTQAGRSGFHAMAFFAAIAPLLQSARNAGRRIFLLTHSMGNYVLASAVETWFGHGKPSLKLFDEVLLAAADERFDSFGFTNGGRLSRLHDLTSRISIYFSERDLAMYLSVAVNFITRLGHDGPEHKSDQTLFQPGTYRIVNCAKVDDYNLLLPPDASHQYYRRSPKVRADIVAVMANSAAVGGGLISP